MGWNVIILHSVSLRCSQNVNDLQLRQLPLSAISRDSNLSSGAPRRSSEPHSISSPLIDKISPKMIWWHLAIIQKGPHTLKRISLLSESAWVYLTISIMFQTWFSQSSVLFGIIVFYSLTVTFPPATVASAENLGSESSLFYKLILEQKRGSGWIYNCFIRTDPRILHEVLVYSEGPRPLIYFNKNH